MTNEVNHAQVSQTLQHQLHSQRDQQHTEQRLGHRQARLVQLLGDAVQVAELVSGL